MVVDWRRKLLGRSWGGARETANAADTRRQVPTGEIGGQAAFRRELAGGDGESARRWGCVPAVFVHWNSGQPAVRTRGLCGPQVSRGDGVNCTGMCLMPLMKLDRRRCTG